MKDKIEYKSLPKRMYIKYIKRAGSWCKTSVVNNKQVQEWFAEKPK